MQLRLDDLTWQDLGGEIVVLDLQGSTYYQLNGSAAVLWTRLAAGAERDDLERELVERYDVDRSRAAGDVEAFIADLRTARLLET
jgi:hypothetical protein